MSRERSRRWRDATQKTGFGACGNQAWWRCWVLAFALAFGAAGSGSEPKALGDARLRIVCESEAMTAAWQRFALACIADIEEFAGPSASPARALTVRFGPRATDASRASEPFTLSFTPEDPMEVLAQRLVGALLRRRFVDAADTNLPVMPSVPWLAAAFSNRILFGNRERYGRFMPDYEPARFAFQRGCFPEVARLLAAPVPPERVVPYRLYALHCDLLALCLTESTDADVVGRLLQLDAHGRPPLESLAFVLQEALQTGESLQSWYERTAADASRRGRRPSDTETTAARFEALASVPVVAPGEHDFRGRRQPVEEVDGNLEALRHDPEALRQLQREFFELVKDAPWLLQEPVARYADACRALGTDRLRTTRKNLRKARHDVVAALDRQRRVDAYLDEQERRFIPAERRFALPLDVVRRYSQAGRELAPDLHRYLDTVSR